MQKSFTTPEIQQILRTLLDDRLLSLETLSAATCISLNWLTAYAAGEPTPALPFHERSHLVNLILSIRYGLPSQTSDERLRDIIGILRDVYHMDEALIANHTNLNEAELHAFVTGGELSAPEKYELSMTVMMLYYLFKYPDYTKAPPIPQED